jgi:hypothetical protein
MEFHGKPPSFFFLGGKELGGQETEFPLRLPERLLRLPALGDVTGNADNSLYSPLFIFQLKFHVKVLRCHAQQCSHQGFYG